VTEFGEDARAGNGAAHVIGTFGLGGERRGDTIEWQATNDMGLRSFLGGRYLGKAGLPMAPNLSWSGPLGTKHQVIQFSTDLEGKPLTAGR